MDAVGEIEIRRTLLRRCHDVGVEAATAELASEAGVPAVLASAWAEAGDAQNRAASREPEALDAAAEAFAALVAHPSFGDADRSDQARVLYGLGVFEAERYQAGMSSGGLGRAIDAFRRAIAAEPADGPDRADYRAALGAALGMRHELDGSAEDLDDGVVEIEAALAALPAGASHRSALLHNLASTLARRYELSSRLSDLERSIAATEEARVDAEPEDLPVLLSGAVNGLMTRYEHVGDIADLQLAATRAQEAVTAGRGTRHEPALLATLGAAELELHDRCRTAGGLERAVTPSIERRS